VRCLIFIITLLLFSCSEKEEPFLVWSKVKMYEVVEINESKHVYGLVLKDFQTGEYWQGYSIGKSCRPPMGVRLEFIERRYKTTTEDWRILVGVEEMCERLSHGKYKLDWQMVY